MNIYVRYFDYDALVHNVDELIDFLSTLPDVTITEDLVSNVQDYVNGPMPYPRRYKIRPRVYFIMIKTTAETMEEFKANKKQAASSFAPEAGPISKKEMRSAMLAETQAGWYYCSIVFKRVVMIPETTKFRYQDTTFSAFMRGMSGQDCYNRMVDHLKNRQDVDLRSQFPSARGNNFTFEYVGAVLTEGMVREATAEFYQ